MVRMTWWTQVEKPLTVPGRVRQRIIGPIKYVDRSAPMPPEGEKYSLKASQQFSRESRRCNS